MWPHPARMPLGACWRGECTAPGREGQPSDQDLKDGCNLGYARCGRLPATRAADAVRFAITGEQQGKLQVRWVLEIAHRPGEHGVLEFAGGERRWVTTHPDARIQRQAECFVDCALRRRAGVAC